MSAASDSLQLAGDIFIVCLILTVGIVCGKMSNQMSQASSKVINQNTVEYLEADIANLIVSSHTGANVKQYITKYRRKLRIELITQESAAVSADPMLISATTALDPLSNKDSVYFIPNAGVFSCEADRDSNGNYSTLRFIQSGASASGSSTPVGENDYVGAKDYILNLIGGDSTMGWDVITNQLKKDYADNQQAKADLIQSVCGIAGQPVVDENSTMTSVVNKASEQLTALKESLSSATSKDSHNREAFSINAKQTVSTEKSPDVIIVTQGGTGEVFTWVNEGGTGWITNKPEITISGTNITNDSYDTTYSVVCYY